MSGRGPTSRWLLLRAVALGALILSATLVPAVAAGGQTDLPEQFSQGSLLGDHPGTGDGRIHVIPAITPYSIKNGDVLTVMAVVRSEQPVATVVANLGGLATVTLQPDLLRGGLSADGTAGIWSAEWTGEGLEERVYAATLTVTDVAGHSYTDHSLLFSDPAAGITDVGSMNYPNGGMRRMDAEVFLTEANLAAAVIDTASGHAYFGLRTTPGRVVKVALGNGDAPPARVGAVTFPDSEALISCGVIDEAKGYAYFGTDTHPPWVVKVALGEGSAPPRRVGSVPLVSIVPGDPYPVIFLHNNIQSGVIDPANGYAYFGTEGSPATVLKVALGEGDAPPSLRRYLILNQGDENLRTGVVDAENGYAYFGTYPDTLPARVVKVRLGEGEAMPERVGAVILRTLLPSPGGSFIEIPDGHPTSAIIDPQNQYAYFGTEYAQGSIVKIALGSGDTNPLRVGALLLNPGEGYLRSAVMDSARGHAYFATGYGHEEPSGKVIKVAVGVGNALPLRLGALELDSSQEAYLQCAVLDSAAGHAYFGTQALLGISGARVVKVGLGEGTATPTRLGYLAMQASSAILGGSEARLLAAIRDPVHGHLYFGTGSTPARVVKVATGGTDTAPARLGSVTFPFGGMNPSDGPIHSAVFDPIRRYAYFGTGNSPGRIVKVGLGSGDSPPTRMGALTLLEPESDLRCAVIDPTGGYAYFGTNTSPGRVVKIALTPGADPPTRVGSVLLPAGENYLASAVIDQASGHAYFGTYTTPGYVVKIALGEGNLPPSRVGSARLEQVLPMPGGGSLVFRESYLASGIIDTEAGYAYFGTDTVPGQVAMVRLGAGSNPPTRVGSLTLPEGEDLLRSAVFDAQRGHLYFGTGTSPGRVVKLSRGAIGSIPTRLGSLTLGNQENNLTSAVIDHVAGYAYFGTGEPDTAGRVVRVALGHKNFIRGMRIDLPEDGVINEVLVHTYAANGHFRLSIHDDSEPKQLLWRSNAIATHPAGGELGVSIASGSPSHLHLPASTYWVTWQVSTNNPAFSYVPGALNDGFVMPFAFGIPPATISQWNVTATSELWTIALAYDAVPAIPGDFNHDGCVNFSDFVLLLDNWGTEVGGTVFNFNAFVDLLDNWGAGC